MSDHEPEPDALDAPEMDALIRRAAPAASTEDREAVCPEDFDEGLLLAWRAGRLEADAAAAVERHLLACACCRQTLRDLAAEVPAATLARMDGALPRRRRVAWWVAGGALAAAAALAFFLLRPKAALPPEYTVRELSGGVAAVRSDGGDSRVFLPESQVRLVVVPAAELSGPAPAARVFLSRAGGVLAALPAGAVTRAGSGAVVVAGLGREIFGETPGAREVLVGLAEDGARLEGLAGQSPAAAREVEGVRWVSVTVEYRTEAP